ncbi:MAG: type II toxin-antitoxin system VapC family toxin [Acidimicrobiia bacterium]|nr:type II toxin-antitoxin system VapC family toxin [Acidimicrobiia bacterium]NNF88320.1 type II toxin-antitoxin system VapC family toxin [Acidimicrobiia bacterium]NNL14840.1 type II toxin-antitoxin system VapC family toxin [Acidimicrobiia bacterium]NNL97718.1 type II toxin-antitoxin system VapC family toxin [Acidimicrobiia bacterium]RZV43941.1 MAG: type II toxin-antitoxin system VapC family toxin [Acidimicrobiia bacterium]
MTEAAHERGLADTSVIISLEDIAPESLPAELAISAVTLAELTAGPHTTDDLPERARRQDRLQRVESTFDPLPFDEAAARAYGRLYAAVVTGGRKAHGARAMDLLIAATAVANQLPLYTLNGADFRSLGDTLEVVEPVTRAGRP